MVSLSFDASDFKSGAQVCAKNTSTVNPILLNTVIRSEGNHKVVFESSNLRSWVRYTIHCESFDAFEVGVNAKTLAEIAGLSEGIVFFEVGANELKVKAPTVYDLPVVDVSDFPSRDSVEGACLEVGAKEFKTALTHALRTVSTDETKEILCGVLFSYLNGTLTLSSSDTHRITLADCPATETTPLFSDFVLPTQVVKLLLPLIEKDEIDLIRWDSKAKTFNFIADDIEVIAGVLDGGFPELTGHFPENIAAEYTIDLNTLQDKISQLWPVIDQNSNSAQIQFGFDKTTLVLRSEGNSKGSAGASMEVNTNDVQSHNFSLQPPYAKDLAAIGGTAQLTLTGEGQPIVVEAENLRYLVCPLNPSE